MMNDEERALMIQGTELAATAAAAYAKAEIACAYEMAIRKPRNIEDVRQKILAACKRPVFAEIVEYSKPIGGGKFIKGPSIRFVETALQALRNVRINTSLLYEDDRIRKVGVCVTDLESNLPYTGEVVLTKTVERKSPRKGQEPKGERFNSSGEKVYIVEATEDDMLTKTNANVSKLIRTLGLRLIPRDIVDEAMDAASEVRRNKDKDPESAKRKILDAFAGLGILPSMVEQYLGKKLEQMRPNDLEDLRRVYTAIQTGESAWSDFVEDAEIPKPETLKEKMEKAKATTPKTEYAKLEPHQLAVQALPPELVKRARAECKIETPDAGLTAGMCQEIMSAVGIYQAELEAAESRGI